jgi:DNA-binding XRE family transcriptional regulator
MKATARRVGFATPEPETVPLQKKHAHSDPTELGLRIRDLRLRKNIALRELAKRANVSPSLLSQIERGKSARQLKPSTHWSRRLMSRSRRFLSLGSRPRRQFTEDRKTPQGTASSNWEMRAAQSRLSTVFAGSV